MLCLHCSSVKEEEMLHGEFTLAIFTPCYYSMCGLLQGAQCKSAAVKGFVEKPEMKIHFKFVVTAFQFLFLLSVMSRVWLLGMFLKQTLMFVANSSNDVSLPFLLLFS